MGPSLIKRWSASIQQAISCVFWSDVKKTWYSYDQGSEIFKLNTQTHDLEYYLDKSICMPYKFSVLNWKAYDLKKYLR